MNRSRVFAVSLGLGIALAAHAATFPYFGPVTGILKGSATSPITTAATSSDVAGLFTGCSTPSTKFLKADGTCSTVASVTPAALTKTDDTNVTLTLGGTPATALLQASSLTLGWTGQLAASRGGTGVSSLGTLSRVDDTNVTMTLGGTPAGALITSTSMTMGWTGQLAVARGGTGAATITGLVKGNGTSAMTAYGGSSCTNQFARGLDSVGAALCASVDLANDVTGVLPGAAGGTNNGFMAFTGPTTSTKTFTLPNATSTILTSNAAVTVAQGGTGVATLTGLVLGNGTSNMSAYAGTSCTNQFTRSLNASGVATCATVNSTDMDLSMTPTWTGAHRFNTTVRVDEQEGVRITDNAGFLSFYNAANTTRTGYMQMNSAGASAWVVEINQPLEILTNNTLRWTVPAAGGLFSNGVTGGAQGAGTINAAGLYINGVPVSGGATTTGSFTGTMTGLTAGVTCTIKYRITGQIVYLYNTGTCTGTSNTNAMTMTGLPAAVQAARNVSCYTGAFLDNGGVVLSGADIAPASGTITFSKNFVTGGVVSFGTTQFTTSGTKGPSASWSCQYDLDS